jgi:hypothetical protein
VSNLRIVVSWLLITAAALYDGYFAWQYRAALGSWEVNPVARWATEFFGLPAVLAFKAGTVLFAAGTTWYCARRNRSLAKGLTGVAGFLYLALSANYVLNLARSPIDWPQVDQLARVGSAQIVQPFATLVSTTATINGSDKSGGTLQGLEVATPAVERSTLPPSRLSPLNPRPAFVPGRGRTRFQLTDPY